MAALDLPDDEFFAIAKRWADDVYVSRPSNVPKIVYHYTDAAGLVGMLRNGMVWATDYRFLNDKSEVAHTRQEVRKIISRKLDGASNEILVKLYGDILKLQDIESNTDAFVFSLSAERDDLSQWRGYARDGEGFTLGFCGSTLATLAETAGSSFAFLQVEYDHQKQTDAMERALEEIEQKLNAVANGSDDLDEQVRYAAAAFDWLTEARAVANKHNSFRQEREWRVVTHTDKAREKDMIKVRTSGARLVRYLEWDFETNDGKLPLKEIGIGPGFQGNEEVLAVRTLCAETEYVPTIYFADTPYRRL